MLPKWNVKGKGVEKAGARGNFSFTRWPHKGREGCADDASRARYRHSSFMRCESCGGCEITFFFFFILFLFLTTHNVSLEKSWSMSGALSPAAHALRAVPFQWQPHSATAHLKIWQTRKMSLNVIKSRCFTFYLRKTRSPLPHPFLVAFTSVSLVRISKELPSRHQTSFYCLQLQRQSEASAVSSHAVDYSYQLRGNGERKSRVRWRGDERGRNSEIRGGKYWSREKIKVQRKEKGGIRGETRGASEKGDWIGEGGGEKIEKMDKESMRGVYLSALCHSSSGHLLRYIKGFALISMPLHPSHGARLCVHPYGPRRLRVRLHVLERVRCIGALASIRGFFELQRAPGLCVHMGLVWSIITPVHWGFQSNACGRVGDSLEWNNQGYGSAGSPPPPTPGPSPWLWLDVWEMADGGFLPGTV